MGIKNLSCYCRSVEYTRQTKNPRALAKVSYNTNESFRARARGCTTPVPIKVLYCPRSIVSPLHLSSYIEKTGNHSGGCLECDIIRACLECGIVGVCSECGIVGACS